MTTMELKFEEQNIISTFKEILQSLSKKEKTVIERRIWIEWEKETLQSIWDSFVPAITRERVRQIEDSWIKKIWRIIRATDLAKIQDYARDILKTHAWVLTKDKLVNALIKELNLTSEMNSYVIEAIVVSDYDIIKSKPKLWTRTYFFLPSINKKNIELIHKETLSILKKKKDVMDRNSLFELVKINLKDSAIKNTFIDAVLDIYEDIVTWEENLIGLTKWKILNPKTLKDKALYILRKEKLPMHFVSIANKITESMSEKVKVNTVHNELIRNEEFILVWRWIYALRDWWIYKPGTVLDVIVDIMRKNWEPMTTEEIMARVLKVRKVKNTTIYMNLQNKKIIERVWRNYYKLKD